MYRNPMEKIKNLHILLKNFLNNIFPTETEQEFFDKFKKKIGSYMPEEDSAKFKCPDSNTIPNLKKRKNVIVLDKHLVRKGSLSEHTRPAKLIDLTTSEIKHNDKNTKCWSF